MDIRRVVAKVVPKLLILGLFWSLMGSHSHITWYIYPMVCLVIDSLFSKAAVCLEFAFPASHRRVVDKVKRWAQKKKSNVFPT